MPKPCCRWKHCKASGLVPFIYSFHSFPSILSPSILLIYSFIYSLSSVHTNLDGKCVGGCSLLKCKGTKNHMQRCKGKGPMQLHHHVITQKICFVIILSLCAGLAVSHKKRESNPFFGYMCTYIYRCKSHCENRQKNKLNTLLTCIT